jgi:glucose-6-phosphate isomerase
MEGLKLIDIKKNQTITYQAERGEGLQQPFNTDRFIRENQITIDITYMFNSPEQTSISKKEIEEIVPMVMKAHKKLKKEEGDIYDGKIPMTGWQNLPEEISNEHISEMKAVTNRLSKEIDAFVSLGIGGSYLGIEATFHALCHNYFNQLTREQRGGAPEIYFLGQNMDPDFFRDTLDMLEGKRIGVNVISKSGTTTETAIAFRIIRQLLEKNWEGQADSYIIATTDKERGALRYLAEKKGYRTFEVPDNVGGRFSVLTDVGLVGLAMANIDIEEFVAGFRRMRTSSMADEFWDNPALVHAAVRYAAWKKGKKIEVIATNSSALYFVAKWMEQLFPESEGHNGHGLWVTPSLYSEKLHANGQMIQQGERNILETFLLLREHDNSVDIPRDEEDMDGLNFLPDNGRDMNFINRKVVEGPAYAHYRGGVPNMTIEIPRRNAFNLGQLYYMMERSVAISGYLLGHNPFVQPGVEAYKKAMFSLIGKPGFEATREEMAKELKKLERVVIHG